MTDFVYLHVFPIVDQGRTLAQLRAEACMDLDALAAEAGAKIVGDPEWTLSGDRLICRAPARPLADDEPRPILAGARTPAQTIDMIRRMPAQLSDREVAYRLGVAPSTVRLYRTEAA